MGYREHDLSRLMNPSKNDIVSRDEPMGFLKKMILVQASKGRKDLSSRAGVVREIREPLFLTTAQERTRTTMFG